MTHATQSPLNLAPGTAGELFWIRQDVPLESMLPPRRKQTADGTEVHRPQARAQNAKMTGGYGYNVMPDGLAVFNINGVITPSQYAYYEDDAMTVSDMLAADVRAATDDNDVKCALFVINSPGGYVAGSYELAETIAAMTAKKPTASFVTNLAASAAYLQAAQTGSITAYKTAYVGSIGTRSVMIDAHVYFESLGIEVIPIDSGGMKSAGQLGTKVTEDQRAYFRSLILKSNALFVDSVATGRKMSVDQAQKLADGRVHLAGDAKSLNLIDGVGQRSDAIARLQKTSPRTATIPKPKQTFSQESSTMSASLQEIKSVCVGAPSDFILDQLEKGATVESAKTEFIAFQNAMIRSRDQEPGRSTTRKPGVPAQAANGAEGQNAGGGESAFTRFKTLVEQRVQKLETEMGGGDRTKLTMQQRELVRARAVTQIRAENEDLHAELIEESNSRHSRADALRRQANAILRG